MNIDLHVQKDDVMRWLESPITQSVLMKIYKKFDHQEHLLGADLGQSLDRFKGRAEVLQWLKPGEIVKMFEREVNE